MKSWVREKLIIKIGKVENQKIGNWKNCNLKNCKDEFN